MLPVLMQAGSWLLKNPAYIAVFVLALACGGLYLNNMAQDAIINSQGAKIENLAAVVDRINNNLQVCETNEMTLQGALDSANTQTQAAHDKAAVLGDQVRSEQARVSEWQKKFQDKQCLTNDDEVTISEGKVVNDEKSLETIDAINSVFDIK